MARLNLAIPSGPRAAARRLRLCLPAFFLGANLPVTVINFQRGRDKLGTTQNLYFSLFYSILFYSILFYYILLHFITFYCFILHAGTDRRASNPARNF